MKRLFVSFVLVLTVMAFAMPVSAEGPFFLITEGYGTLEGVLLGGLEPANLEQVTVTLKISYEVTCSFEDIFSRKTGVIFPLGTKVEVVNVEAPSGWYVLHHRVSGVYGTYIGLELKPTTPTPTATPQLSQEARSSTTLRVQANAGFEELREIEIRLFSQGKPAGTVFFSITRFSKGGEWWTTTIPAAAEYEVWGDSAGQPWKRGWNLVSPSGPAETRRPISEGITLVFSKSGEDKSSKPMVMPTRIPTPVSGESRETPLPPPTKRPPWPGPTAPQ